MKWSRYSHILLPALYGAQWLHLNRGGKKVLGRDYEKKV